jgi:sensor histidine kinase YesM
MNPPHSHIGLENVVQRIKMIYGKSYGIGLTSESGYGTFVVLHMPFMTEDKR